MLSVQIRPRAPILSKTMTEKSNTESHIYESYTREWYENVVKKDPELLKWFNETVMTPEYYE